jgi:16S rRNA (guanine966-N2)-methyltransferase
MLQRSRESIAGILRERIPGAAVGDFCAGSGIFGFEMISRGAKQVDFIERDRKRADAIRAHAKKFGLENRCRIFPADIARFVSRCRHRYDIIYFDPPYSEFSLQSLFPDCLCCCCPSGVMLFEHSGNFSCDEIDVSGERIERDTRRYGSTVIDIFYLSG